MAYQVIEDFTDLKAGGRVYRKGDAFPEEGLTVAEERLKELSTTENKRKTILIEEVKTEPKKAAKKANKDK